MYLNLLVCDRNIFWSSWKVFSDLRWSLKILVIFYIFQKYLFQNVHVAFRQFLENRWKSLKSGQKCSGKFTKMWLSVWLYNEQSNKWLQACRYGISLVMFSFTAVYLTLKILSWTLKEVHVFYIILYLAMYYTVHSITLN